VTITAKPTHIELQAALTDLLATLGFQYLHVRRSVGFRKGQKGAYQTVTNIKGWPDCAPVWKPGSPRILAIEVKVPPDKLRPEQEDVLWSLDSAGVECFVFRPGDTQEMAEILKGIRNPDTSRLRWPPRASTTG
jgi:hypothetical protein